MKSITAISFVANPEHLAKAKQRLTEALHEIAEILTEGNCTEVYGLNAQLFSYPLFESLRDVSKDK